MDNLVLIFLYTLAMIVGGMCIGVASDDRAGSGYLMGLGAALILIGAFYVFCAWGLQTGWGVNNLDALANSPTAPAFVLADRLWAGGSIIVLIALVNSGVGVCIACTTSSTRTIFGMARTGALPTPLATVSKRHGTPVTAVVLQTAIAVTIEGA